MIITTLGEVWRYGVGTKVNYDNRWCLYVGKDINGAIVLMDYATQLDVDLWEVTDDVEVLVDVKTDIDTLINYKTRETLMLVSEGWIENKENRHFDITGQMDELRGYVRVQRIVDDVTRE